MTNDETTRDGLPGSPAHGLAGSPPNRRRPRYAGKHPRRFSEKYKEHRPEKYTDTVAKVLASGKTPAGTHRPIMVREILEILRPQPGEIGVDATLGYGGHAQEILAALQPGGRLIGLDTDPLELPKTEVRLRGLGYGAEVFSAVRTNFAGLPQALAKMEVEAVDFILADLGVSSMQLDNPARGFSLKEAGPLDMRMNPERGEPAEAVLRKISPAKLTELFQENADEPHAPRLGQALAGGTFPTTTALLTAIRNALPTCSRDERELSARRVFQALRIAVNDEFSALEMFLRQIPQYLTPGGRVAIITFHSGEDRRVKKAFAAGKAAGVYAEIAEDVTRPTFDERSSNPRSASAKLRWAICASDGAGTGGP